MNRVLRPLVVVVLAGLSRAQSVKLNGPLARELRSGTVTEFHFTQDGTRVVYRADQVVAGRYELFSRPLDGSSPSILLSGPMQPNGDIAASGVSSGWVQIGAGERVVYIADEAVDNVFELHSVPADGSASRIRISAGTSLGRFRFTTPAKTHVVYQNVNFVEGTGPLYVVAIDGSSVPLDLTPGVSVGAFWVSPDGATAVFTALATSPGMGLYAVPTDGSAAPQLLAQAHPPADSGVRFGEVVFTPDGLRIVYEEYDDFFDEVTPSLYSVRLDASQPADSIAPLGQYNGGPFALVPDAVPMRVVFERNSAVVSALLDGSGSVTLTPPGWSPRGDPLVVGTDVLFSSFLPGGTTIHRAPSDGSSPAFALFPMLFGNTSIFRLASADTLAFVNTASTGQLYAVPLAGGTPLPLHAPLAGDLGPIWILPHPDGQRVLFRGDNETSGVHELYVVPLDASAAPTKLNGPLSSNEDVLEEVLTPDLAHVAFRAGVGNIGDGGSSILFRVPLDASAAPFQLNEATLGAVLGDVQDFALAPGDQHVVYRADQESDEHFDLYAVDSNGERVSLSAGVPSVLADYAFSPLGERVVFHTQGPAFELRSAELTTGATVLLDASVLGFAAPFVVTPDGARVVYRRRVTPSTFELCSVAMDALEPPVLLHAPLPAGRGVEQFRTSAAGVVVFLADLGLDDVLELWAAPIDGSAAPVRLSQALSGNLDVSTFELDASGAFAVYLADAKVNSRTELYSVPLDASRAPRRLNDRLPPAGDVTEFALTPDGTRVVYRADQRSDNRFDLFSVPLVGSPPPHAELGEAPRPRTTLLSALPSGRAVQPDWSLSPDGAWVVYRANPTTLGELELVRVPFDGHAAPQVLGAPLPTGSDVTAFALAPDQSRVVYLADQRLNDVFELFSVPFGGGAVVALDTLPSFGDVAEFHVDPSSLTVAYTADRNTNALLELFRVPLDGSLAPVQLNPTLVPGGSVQPGFVALPGVTLYRADQQKDEVFELYLAF